MTAFNKYDYEQICSVAPEDLLKWGLPTGENGLAMQRDVGIQMTLVDSAEGKRVRQYSAYHATVTDLLLVSQVTEYGDSERQWAAYQWRVLTAPYEFSAAGYRRHNKEDFPDLDLLVLSAEVMLAERDNASWAHTASALTWSNLVVFNVPYDTAGTVARYLSFAATHLATRRTPKNPADVRQANLIRVGTCPPPPF